MNIEIANRLVELRKKHELSQEELAGRLGISRQAVSKWERAEASPDTDNLILLARLYGVSLDELLLTNAPDEAVREDAAAAPGWKPTEDDVVRMVREAWRQSSPPEDGRPQANADPFYAETPRPPEPPRDAFTGEAPAWEPAPEAGNDRLQPEWPNTVPVRKVKTFGGILRSLRGIYPILCLFVFLFFGFILHIWHPTWMVFLTTPIFYVLADKLE